MNHLNLDELIEIAIVSRVIFHYIVSGVNLHTRLVR